MNIRPEIIKKKNLEEKISSKLFDIGLSDKILNLTPKPKAMKAKIIKWDYIKFKNFYTAKAMTNKMKRQPTEWEKIIANHISDKKLISKIYKEITHSQITIKQPIWLKIIEDLSGHFSKVDIHRPIATDQHCWPPEIPLRGIYTNKMKTWIWKEICAPMFIAALFTIAKI